MLKKIIFTSLLFSHLSARAETVEVGHFTGPEFKVTAYELTNGQIYNKKTMATSNVGSKTFNNLYMNINGKPYRCFATNKKINCISKDDDTASVENATTAPAIISSSSK